MIGRIKELNTKSELLDFENVSMIYFDDQLLVRHSGLKPSPFIVYDPYTLQEDKETSKEIQ
jgi:hypothetical protein